MGSGTWSSDAYRTIKTSYATKTTDDIFTSSSLTKDMSPIGVDFRESRDSVEHPESLALIVGLDVTGSMGAIPENLVRGKLGTIMETVIKYGVAHPQIMFMGLGDQDADRAPLQVGQFESETTLVNSWLSKIYLEGGGGGQTCESYQLAWLFGSRHTSIDCFEKRGIKGFLFTIGDEGVWDKLTEENLKQIMGYTKTEPVTTKQLLKEVQRTYHVFHIAVNNSAHIDDWKKLLGERLLILDDYQAVAELIASTVAVMHGIDLKTVTSTFDSKTAKLVTNALAKVTTDVAKSSKGIVNI